MADELRFDGKVVIVTGAGGGLGRAHALLFAQRGARVVVNDLGGSHTGEGASQRAADAVVEEIRAAGGEAVASHDSVEDGARIVQTALDTFGALHVVVNNAGILRDVSFAKMTEQDWDLVYRVHVKGAFAVTHAAWPHLRDGRYGRVLMTASAAGIYGNFGQANYAMAKLGLHGLAQTLALEGRRHGIHVNTIAPIAGSRMTETVMPKEIVEALRPELVSPLVAWLCHDACEETGGLFEVGGGFFGKLRWERAAGKTWRLGRAVSPEQVRDRWAEIAGFEATTHPSTVAESTQPILENVQRGPSKGGNEYIDVDEALGWSYPPVTSSYDARDLALYALGVGAGRDPLDERELASVYERHGAGFLPLPTFAVVPALKLFFDFLSEGKQAPGMRYGLERVLHGEQRVELRRPLPERATLRHEARVKDIFDKGKGATVVIETKSYDEDGDLLFVNETTSFVRGAGGWGGDRGPTEKRNVPPERAPDAVVEEVTRPDQALLYRLTGDWNPLHADPGFAKAFGFDRPILHGLCTFGFAGRHVIGAFAPRRDPRYFRSIEVRFADVVYPGETLVTEMWRESGTRVVFRVRVKERDVVAISNAAVELFDEIPTKRPKPAPAAETAVAAAAPAPTAEPASAAVFRAIGAYVAAHPELVGQVGRSYLWKLSDPSSEWTLDLRNAPGKVAPGAEGTADCTLELSEGDFLAMTAGQADPQKLYFGGKLRIGGDVMASQKLTFLAKVREEAARPAAPEAGGAGRAEAGGAAPGAGAAPAIFEALARRLAAEPRLAGELGARVVFRVRGPDGAWVVDARTAPGRVHGADAAGEGEADATVTLDDGALAALVRGETTARDLHQRGKLRVDGRVEVAHRLGLLKNLL